MKKKFLTHMKFIFEAICSKGTFAKLLATSLDIFLILDFFFKKNFQCSHLMKHVRLTAISYLSRQHSSTLTTFSNHHQSLPMFPSDDVQCHHTHPTPQSPPTHHTHQLGKTGEHNAITSVIKQSSSHLAGLVLGFGNIPTLTASKCYFTQKCFLNAF